MTFKRLFNHRKKIHYATETYTITKNTVVTVCSYKASQTVYVHTGLKQDNKWEQLVPQPLLNLRLNSSDLPPYFELH